MANGTVSAPAKSVGAPSKILNLLSKITWYELLAVPVIAVVAAIFWFKEAITEAFLEAQERTTTSFGIGMMPLGIWTGVFVAAMIIKPSLFRHYRYWLASALFVLLALGLLSLFRPLDGPLAWFTLDGYISLGGTVGETIAGPMLWQQILRLGSLAILAVSVLDGWSAMPVSVFCSSRGALAICSSGKTTIRQRSWSHPTRCRAATETQSQTTIIQSQARKTRRHLTSLAVRCPDSRWPSPPLRSR